MTLLGFKFLPFVLGGLAVFLLALFWSLSVRRSVIRRLTEGVGASSIRTSASPLRRKLRTSAMIISVAAIAFTILRPIGGSVLTENRLPAKNLILLFDSSKSMGVGDADGLTRLEAAKLFAREFVNRRPADRIGLVSFDGIAFPECPTTIGRTMLLNRIDIQIPGGLKVHGSDLAAALDESSNLLTADPPPGSAIILLSDGDRLSEDPIAAAAAIIEKDVPILAVGFGEPGAESSIPNSALYSRADPNTLRKLTESTGGLYVSGSRSDLDSSLASLNQQIDTMKIDNNSEVFANLQSRPLELYAYPLAVALLFLLLRFFIPKRSKKWHQLSAVLAGLWFLPQSGLAQGGDVPEIYQPFVESLKIAVEKKRPLLVLFTGSDWSEASFNFETEIYRSSIYKQWSDRAVVELVVDLPRSNIDAKDRKQRRALASRLGVRGFPTVIFLDSSETEIGRLGHDSSGPASWVRRAELILSGADGASTSESNVEGLPDSVRQSLEESGLTSSERAIRYYNQAIEYHRFDAELATASPDRFRLLDDLLSNASAFAPEDRPDIASEVAALRAVLHHERGQAFLPKSQQSTTPGNGPKPDATRALKIFRDALMHYRDSAKFNMKREDLTPNLGRLYTDIRRAEDLINFQKAYKQAVEDTDKALKQETRFRNSLDRWVTTSFPVNDKAIETSQESIVKLLDLAEIVKAPMLEDIKGANDDIGLAPTPHESRGLHESTQHIKNALEHLVKQQQSGEGNSNDPFARPQPDQQDREDSGGDGEEEPRANPNGELDLRRSQNGSGDLRDRQLDALGRGNKNKSKNQPGQDH